MAKDNRQAINLIRWQAKNRKPTDPQFSTRAILKPEIAQYISEVTKDGGNPELFLTLWINKATQTVALGLAVPREYVPREHIPTLEDFWE